MQTVHLDGLVMDDEIECPFGPPACVDLKTYPVKV